MQAETPMLTAAFRKPFASCDQQRNESHAPSVY